MWALRIATAPARGAWGWACFAAAMAVMVAAEVPYLCKRGRR